MIIADTNLLIYFHVPGEHTADATLVFQKDQDWVAPILWRSEFRNTMMLYYRKNILSLDQILLYTKAAERLLAGREYQVQTQPILRLAAQSGCTAYDCEFVALAQELHTPLITADKQILRAFPETAVSPQQYLAT